MEPTYLLGVLIALLAFLLHLFLKRRPLKVANVPIAFREAMNRQLSQTKYSNLIEFWLAVSKMETAGFTSELYRVANNPWGMKKPVQRVTTANGSVLVKGNEWARYETLQDAARDIVLWMDARRFPDWPGSLAAFVGAMKEAGYFEEPFYQYLKLVKLWLQR